MISLDELNYLYENGDLDDLSDEQLRGGILLCDDSRQRLYNRHGGKYDDVATEMEHLTSLSAAMQTLTHQRQRMQATVTA